MKTWWYVVRIIGSTPLLFVGAMASGIAVFGLPLILGLITQAFFDSLTGNAPAGLNVWSVLALMVAGQLVRAFANANLSFWWIGFFYGGMAKLRANLLRQLLAIPGAVPMPGSAGEAIGRFRDDVETIVDSIDAWIDIVGRTIFAVAAFVVMARIHLPLTIAVAAMLAISVPIINLAGDRIATYSRLNHEAIAQVTGFLGEIFSAVQAVKAAGATPHTVRHLRKLGERRRKAALRDELWQGIVNAIDSNVVTFGTGLVLLVAGQSMRSGEFTVGDFALFVVYLSDLMWFPDEIARWFISYRQASVSLARLARLQAPADPRSLVADLPPKSAAVPGIATNHVPVRETVRYSSVPHPEGAAVRSLALPAGEEIDRAPMLPLLESIDLGYRYPGSNRGIQNVSLRLERGSFVVLTGPIGAGKTTILQVLLGLLPRDGGEIFWKGQLVADPTSFFGPPRTAYVPQVPKLFSETFRSNLEQGLASAEPVLKAAIHRAVLEHDLVGLPDGLETFVGPRGTRLSGGQVQRAAAARAFVREPELVVVDDLSSALDVETEETLWDRLAAWRQETPGLTILAVSHRPAAFRRADRVVILEEGKILS